MVNNGCTTCFFPGTTGPTHARTPYDCQLMLLHLEIRNLQPRGILALVSNKVPVDCQSKHPRMFPFLSFIIYLCIPSRTQFDYDLERPAVCGILT